MPQNKVLSKTQHGPPSKKFKNPLTKVKHFQGLWGTIIILRTFKGLNLIMWNLSTFQDF